MIVSAGEALIDLMPAVAADGAMALRPRLGGAPFNVAIALGRLGAPAAMLGAISTDAFGDALVEALEDSNVSTALVTRVARPTPLAIVDLAADEPRYAFYDAGTAARGVTLRELKPLPPEARWLSFGSITLAGDPAASTMIARAAASRAERLIAFDPNVRPALAGGAAHYRRNLEAALARADLVKLSAADLAWLRPDQPAETFAAECLAQGAAFVVVTQGENGATGFLPAARVETAGLPVTVADTVGAGDAFMAGLLAALSEGGVTERADLARLDEATVAQALAFANRVAARACTRPGADPPHRSEV